MNRAKEIVASHMKIHFHTRRKHQEAADPSPKAIYRYFRQSGSAGIDLLLLGLADTRATYEQTLTQEAWVAALDVTAQFMEAWFEKAEEIIAPPALLNGNDLMTELPLKPGPEIGTLLEAIREHQVSGNIHTRAEALAFALGWHFAKTHTPTGK
jgi:poly(A) polymerase